MNKHTFKSTLIILSFALISNSAMAERGGEGNKKQRRGPPAEAIEACSNLNEGDVCQFSGRRGDASGTCFLPPKDGSELACKPSDHKEKD
jgi:hypothetical protein